MVENIEFNRMSKRSFLKAATAAGVSLTSLRLGTQEGLAKANDDEYIPYVKALVSKEAEKGDNYGAMKPIYDRIHRDEWVPRWTARDASKRIQNRLNRKFSDPYLSAGWGVDAQSSTGFGIEVRYEIIEGADGTTRSPRPSVEEVREQIPGKQRGVAGEEDNRDERTIPVKVVEQREQEVACLQDYDWESVPGGSAMSSTHSSPSAVGTYTAPFYHRDYQTEGMIASGHVCEVVDSWTRDADVNKHAKARIVNVGSDVDYAWCEFGQFGDANADSDGAGPQISDPNGSAGATDYDIEGIVTEDELSTDVGKATTYYIQGDANCRQSGVVNFYDTNNHWFEQTNNTAGGDSGGPVWKEDSGGAALIAGVTVSDLWVGGTKATVADYIQSQEDGYFMTAGDTGV
jgi:hypothetical protein